MKNCANKTDSQAFAGMAKFSGTIINEKLKIKMPISDTENLKKTSSTVNSPIGGRLAIESRLRAGPATSKIQCFPREATSRTAFILVPYKLSEN